jgi:hypothetical protein
VKTQLQYDSLAAWNERKPSKNHSTRSDAYHGRGSKSAALKEGERLGAAQSKHWFEELVGGMQRSLMNRGGSRFVEEKRRRAGPRQN